MTDAMERTDQAVPAASSGRQVRSCDVAIIGAGPSGLAAATELKRLGLGDVLVLEREAEAGGVPRHCGHPPFGVVEYKRLLTGPSYARELARAACRAGVAFSLKTTVTALRPGGLLSLATPEGRKELRAGRVLIATGARETPRSARLVPGQRAWGVMNTGALQAMVYLKNLVPFRRPLVVGTELVSFSALLTCRRAGIRPVAMIEPNARPTVRWPLHYAHALFGVPLRLNTQIVNIRGDERVRAVRLRDGRGGEEDIACDGVLFTGRFTPESSLARASRLDIDPGSGGPSVDQFGRCSDPLCFASGNLLRPVEVSFRCWREGIDAARRIWRDLDEGLPAPDMGCVRVHARPPLRYVLPQRLIAAHDDSAMKDFQLRVDRPVKGRLRISGGDGAVLYERALSAIPEQRILAPIPPLEALRGETEIVIDIV